MDEKAAATTESDDFFYHQFPEFPASTVEATGT